MSRHLFWPFAYKFTVKYCVCCLLLSVSAVMCCWLGARAVLLVCRCIWFKWILVTVLIWEGLLYVDIDYICKHVTVYCILVAQRMYSLMEILAEYWRICCIFSNRHRLQEKCFLCRHRIRNKLTSFFILLSFAV